jgi:putative Mn2+ efflux pump MntP
MAKGDSKNDVKVSKKNSYFPKSMIFGGFLIILMGITGILQLFILPKFISDITLIIAGLWLILTGISKGFNKTHREIVKKYI